MSVLLETRPVRHDAPDANPSRLSPDTSEARRSHLLTRLSENVDPSRTPNDVPLELLGYYAERYAILAGRETSTGDVQKKWDARLTETTNNINDLTRATEGYGRVAALGIKMIVGDVEATFPTGGTDRSPYAATADALGKIVDKYPMPKRRRGIVFTAVAPR